MEKVSEALMTTMEADPDLYPAVAAPLIAQIRQEQSRADNAEARANRMVEALQDIRLAADDVIMSHLPEFRQWVSDRVGSALGDSGEE
jgi:hypothetical protein